MNYIEEYVSHRPICSVWCLLAREWIKNPTSSQKTEADRAKSVLKNIGFQDPKACGVPFSSRG